MKGCLGSSDRPVEIHQRKGWGVGAGFDIMTLADVAQNGITFCLISPNSPSEHCRQTYH